MCREGNPRAAHLIANNKFMDDFVGGFEDGNGEVSIYYELTALFKTIKLPMGK